MKKVSSENRLALAVGLVSIFCLGLLGLRIMITGTTRYYFIPGNLALAWGAWAASWLLVKRLSKHRWVSWQNIALSLIWLILLPNTWYVLTDFIHVYPNGEISQLFDIALIGTLVVCGFTLGFSSLYMVHKQLINRLDQIRTVAFVLSVILLSSFAIYLGRDMRWNSWDVLSNPEGLLLNLSDRIVDPFAQPRAWSVTLLFFAIIGVFYGAISMVYPPTPKEK
jgi:uncharacterized membrane protein